MDADFAMRAAAHDALVAEQRRDLDAAGIAAGSDVETIHRHLMARAAGNPAMRPMSRLLDDVTDCMMGVGA